MNEELKREELENVTGGFETKGDSLIDVTGKSVMAIGGGVDGDDRPRSRRDGQDEPGSGR